MGKDFEIICADGAGLITCGLDGAGLITCGLDGTVRNLIVDEGVAHLSTCKEIRRFDLAEYRLWIGDTKAQANAADILNVGYFTKDGFYEPPAFDFRREALRQHQEDGDVFPPDSPFNYATFRSLEVEGCVEVDNEGGVQVAARGETPQFYSVYARVPEAVCLADFEAAEHGDLRALGHAVKYANALGRELGIGVQVQPSVAYREGV